METKAGIRELKARLSAYVRKVKAGGTVVVTEYGRPVARIVPINQTAAARLETLKDAGLVAWSGERLTPLAPVARTRGHRCVAELLVEDRE